jgi:hypothetical protein
VALAVPVPVAPAPVVAAAGPVPPAAAAPPPAVRDVEYVPVPLLWLRMLKLPPPAGRLMLSNYSFLPAHVQAVLASGPECAIGDAGTVTDFVLPPNGTRVLPAPPGMDVCWRRENAAGEANGAPPNDGWTAWSRALTGPGRFLDAVVLTPEPPAEVYTAEETPPPQPPPVPPAAPPSPIELPEK